MSKEQKAIGYRLVLFVMALVTMILLAGFAFSTGDEAATASNDVKIKISKVE